MKKLCRFLFLGSLCFNLFDSQGQTGNISQSIQNKTFKAILVQRGDESSEWSRAWKVWLWTRMKDGNHALKILRGYYRDESHAQLLSGRGKVMQIDVHRAWQQELPKC
jgi:hypothetical protein